MSTKLTDQPTSDLETLTFRKSREAAVVLTVVALSTVAVNLWLAATLGFSAIWDDELPRVVSWIVFTMLSLMGLALPLGLGWAAVDYFNSRLIFSPGRFGYYGLFSKEEFLVADVIEVQYPTESLSHDARNNNIKIVGSTSTLRLRLLSFKVADQPVIAQRLHDIIEPDRQYNYLEFLSFWKKSKEEHESNLPGLFWVLMIGFGLITCFGFLAQLYVMAIITMPAMAIISWIAWKRRIFHKQDHPEELEQLPEYGDITRNG